MYVRMNHMASIHTIGKSFSSFVANLEERVGAKGAGARATRFFSIMSFNLPQLYV